VIEKAYTYVRFEQNTYSSLDSGFSAQTLQALGFRPSSTPTSAPNFADFVTTTLVARHAIVVETPPAIVAGAPMIAAHAYSIIGATTAADGTVWFTLRNPWGFDGAGADGNPGDSLVTVSAAQLAANCKSAIYVTV
jgi:hypothetical protein